MGLIVWKMTVCHFCQTHFSQMFGDEAAFEYNAVNAQTYCGFKALVLTSAKGGH